MPLIGRKKVEKAIDKLVLSKNRKLRLEYVRTFRAIVIGTPVDQGRARANWFLTTGKPSTKKTKSTSASKAYLKTPKIVMGKKVSFTNNLPYIETLEFGGFPKDSKGTKTQGGYSIQVAPDGWVRKQIIVLRQRIKKI